MTTLLTHTLSEKFADPGFRGEPRYPIDTEEHIRAAWSYIHMPKNRKFYTPSQLKHIEDAVRAAGKKAGIQFTVSSPTRLLSSIQLYLASPNTPKIELPAPDENHFYTGGRLLSYFPQVNENGVAFFRDDCQHLAKTLMASTVDIQHIKPGYPVKDPGNLKNTTCGAIFDVVEHEDGIDIGTKIERDVVKSLGFNEEDFAPGGKLGAYSQECLNDTLSSSWIIVDKDDPTKIVREVSYAEGLALGYRRSEVGKDGKWNFYTVDGNPVYVRIRPVGFSGAGHVLRPADPSATIMQYAANYAGNRMLASFYPGMDEGMTLPMEMVSDVGAGYGADKNVFAQDFLTHPDLLSCMSDLADGDADDPARPDDHYAVSYITHDYDNGPHKVRAFPIKDKKGKMDRNKLISAYHALTGMRGDVHTASSLPENVRAHAMGLVRKGLNDTLPKLNKEKSSTNMDPLQTEIDALEAKMKELSSAKDAKTAEFDAFKVEHEKLVASLNAEITDLKAKLAAGESAIKEFKDKELASARLAQLDAIHPFSEDEKKAETFVEFSRSLASLSEDGLKIAMLQREIAKRDSAGTRGREVSSLANAASHIINILPDFSNLPKIEGVNSHADIL